MFYFAGHGVQVRGSNHLVCPAIGTVDLRKRFAAPPFIQTRYPLVELRFVRLSFAAVIVINRKHVRNVDVLNILEAPCRGVLLADVSG
ncbi:hypothetical protein ABIC02_007058 [Bradyrhizobium sp. RT5a]